jgi:SAM-dependent methyltransferase
MIFSRNHSGSASDTQWYDTLVRSIHSPQISPLGEPLPAFPPEELQRNTTGLSSEAAVRQAFEFYRNAVDALGRAGKPLEASSRVLDFGFGWGRVSRVFMDKVSIRNIHGVDVDEDFASLTRELFDSANFRACKPFPPTQHADGSFDVICAYSVFSHLSGAACHAWMQEFARLLTPGGVVVFTTRHVSFMDFCEWAGRQPDAPAYWRALGNLFSDFEEARARYRRGELVHASSAGVSGGGPRDSTFYGETWIPEQYVRTQFGPDLEFVAGYFDREKYDQACFALRRRAL